MSDLKLTNEKMKAYDGEKGLFRNSSSLERFGENQNAVNELLAANVNELIKRVCTLEDQQVRNNDIMKKMAAEIQSLKAEVDRLKLTAKLNTNAIARMSNAGSADSGEE